MSLPVYPRGDLDNPALMLEMLGTYWSKYAPDNEFWRGVVQARIMMYEQTCVDTDEAKALLARSTAPVYHTELWTPLYFLQSAVSDSALTLTYGENQALYGQPNTLAPYDRVFTYGESIASQGSAFVLPTGVKNIRAICNRIDQPTLVMVRGVDFNITTTADGQRIIVFPFSVFSDSRIRTSTVYGSTGLADTRAELYGFVTEWDREYIYKHYGYVLGSHTESSEAYRQYVNAVSDAHVNSLSEQRLLDVVSAVMDVPLAASDETVELVLSGRKLQIVTDQSVYSFHADSTPLVSVGDEVKKGDRLVNTFNVVNFKNIDDTAAQYSLYPSETVQPDASVTWSPATVTKLAGPYIAAAKYHTLGAATATYMAPIYYVTLAKDKYGVARAFSSFRVATAVARLVSYGMSSATATTMLASALASPGTTITVPGYSFQVPFWEGSDDFADGAGYSDTLEYVFGTYSTTVHPTVESLRTLGSDTTFPYGFEYSYHGPFVNEEVTVTTSNLPTHSALKLSFKLLVSGNWKGNTDGIEWEILVDGVSIKKTNFSNYVADRQAYPGESGSEYDSHSGAYYGERSIGKRYSSYSLLNSSGDPGESVYNGDSVYDFNLVVPHTLPTATIVLKASGLPEGSVCVMYPSGRDRRVVENSSGKPILTGRWTAFRGIMSEADAADLPYYSVQCPSAFWGVQDFAVTTINSTRTTLPEKLPQLIETSSLYGLSLGANFLLDNITAPLFFINADVPVEYIPATSVLDRPDVKFAITGYENDVDLFWENVHTRGLESGFTLANYLDRRANPTGDPQAHHLPSTVNPMKLVLRHLLAYNLFAITLKLGLEGDQALGAEKLAVLRNIVPAPIAVLLFSDLLIPSEEVVDTWHESLAVAAGPIVEEAGEVLITEDGPYVIAVEGVLI